MTGGPPHPTATPLPLSRFEEAARRKPRRQSGIIFHRVDCLPDRVPRSETISGLAAAGEVVALVGAPSSGKSALATLAARALSEGSPFLGRPVLRGATIYVAAERAGEVERRLRAAAAPGAAIYVSGSRPQLAEPSSIDELVRAIRATIGLTQASELIDAPGVAFAGFLPNAVNASTPYAAAVTTTTQVSRAAHAFIAFVTGPTGSARLRQAGWDVEPR